MVSLQEREHPVGQHTVAEHGDPPREVARPQIADGVQQVGQLEGWLSTVDLEIPDRVHQRQRPIEDRRPKRLVPTVRISGTDSPGRHLGRAGRASCLGHGPHAVSAILWAS